MAGIRRDDGDFCFVHAADLHLDTPFSGIGEVAPLVAAALREASLEAFDALVELCLQRDAAFLVVAGDVYDGAERGIRAQLRFRDGLRRLSDAGIAAFVAHGNHDPVDTGWVAVDEWPPLVTVFGADEVTAVPVLREGRRLAVVQGISYGRRDVRENLALRFSRPAGGGFHVGVLHCNVKGAGEGHDDYSPCSLEDLQRCRLDYWALGHIHGRTILSGRPHGDEPWVVYPGNLQARSPKASERGAKGATVVEVEDGRVAGAEFVPCDRVRFAVVEADVGALDSLAAVHDVLSDAARAALDEAEGRSLVLRGVLTGRGGAHIGLRRHGALDELLASLRDGFSPVRSWVWWSRLDDETSAGVDLEELRGGSDFPADLIAVAESLGRASSVPTLMPTLESCLPSDLVEEVTSTLPRALRARAVAMEMSAHELLGAGLTRALDELGETPVGAEASR